MSGLAFPKLAEQTNSRMEPDLLDFWVVAVVVVFVVVVVVLAVAATVAAGIRRSLVVLLVLVLMSVLMLVLLLGVKVALDFWTTLGDSDLDRDLAK
jgi:protein-S-isoprenylcysteine O-methyltransferase Ste14